MAIENKKLFFGQLFGSGLLAAAVFACAFFGFNHIKEKQAAEKARNVSLNSKAAYVYDLTDDKELFSRNGDKRLKPASLVKMMTVYVALKNTPNISETAPVDEETYKRMVKEDASMAGFFGRESTTYRDLLYGAMLASGGECANSLAVNISGSDEKFVALMNKTAKEMKLNNTEFATPDGMDHKNQFSSAKDMAMLLKNALKDEDFKAIFTKKEYTSTSTLDHPDGLKIESTVLSKLDKYSQEGFKIVGGKSGTTDGAGLCWATLAERGGKNYIVVVLGAPIKDNDISDPGDGQIRDTLKLMKMIPDFEGK